MKWQNVYIFISSTFNDMHAERDYLIKRVFPELRLWCAEHKLKLIDIDLRWGVSEKDATENKRVVDVCLNNVDKCRPFLLCLLGQRRGWVPGLSDINEETLTKFPGLKEYIGKSSITELEIIHGLLHPLNDGSAGMRHAFFYHREADYIEQIESEEIRQVFERETDDSFMDSLKESYDVMDYSAEWNPGKVSLELKNVQGKDLSQGRLENFKIGDVPLSIVVSSQLKAAIADEFPEHFADAEELDDIGRELNHQDNFLFSACDSYISRLYEEAKILDYLNGDVNKPCVFMADAGTGKTSMLAWLIGEKQIAENVIYRFIGTSSASSDVAHTLHQLVEELARKGLITEEDLEEAKTNIMLKFPATLNKIKGNCNIILDAVDQWNHITPSSFKWLPESLPENVKVLLSIKKDGQADIVEHLASKNYFLQELSPISDDGEKTAIIASYLSSFLKDIDEKQIGHILRLPGSGNPLYLKIVLNELRIHGSFDTLMEQLEKDYGATPKEAFQMVLNRLETEEFGAGIPSAELVKYVLGTIACSTEGVLIEEFGAICKNVIAACGKMDTDDILDAVYGLVRHLSAYLVIDGNRVNFLYDSFRRAVNERYQDAYHEFHHLLAMIYSRYCYKKGGATYDVPETSYLTNYIYHATECSKSWAETILTDPWFVYRLVSKVSAGQTATYFYKIAEKYPNSEEYLELAHFMERYSMRLNIGPNTLFDMLKRYVGFENSLSYTLCDKASKVMELEYYYPAKEELAAGLRVDRELNMYTGGSESYFTVESFIWGQYIIYVDDETILFQNMDTEEIEKQVKLSRTVARAYVLDGYLYLHYAKSDLGEYGDIETFLLPSMESVFFSGKKPDLPENFDWYTIAYGNDGIQYQYAMDYNETEPDLFVYNMNTCEVQIHSTFPTDLPKKREYMGHDVTWCGEYLKEECKSIEKCRIWHVPTGRLLLETDTYWGNLITCEGNDMWYVTIMREGGLTAYHYRKENETDIVLLDRFERIDKTFIHAKQVGLLHGNLYLFFDSGDFWVFDEHFQFLGHQKLPFKVDEFAAGSFTGNRFMYSNGEQFFFKQETQLQFFDVKACVASLNDIMEIRRDTESYKAIQFGQRLALLSRHENHILNLQTLKCNYSQKYPGFAFYEPTVIHIGQRRCIADVRGVGDLFEALMIDSYDLSVGLRFHDERSENLKRTLFMFYQDGIVGVAFRNMDSEKKDVREHKENPEYEKIKGVKEQKIVQNDYEAYTIKYYNARDNFKLVDVWEPGVWAVGNCIDFFTLNDTPYIIVSDVYVDEDHSELHIYHAMSKELVFCRRYDHTRFHIGSKSEFFVIDGHFFIRNYSYEASVYHYWEIDLEKNCINEHIINSHYLSGAYERKLYFYDSFDYKICVYDLDKKEIINEFATKHHRFNYGVIKKGNRLLVPLSGGICEVYDAETMEYLYSQMLISNYSYVKNLENTDMIFTSTDSSDYTIFKAGNTRDLMKYL